MGSICDINRLPKTWPAYPAGKSLKPEFGGEELYVVRYGTFDDYPDEASDMEMLMRKSIYQGLLLGEFSVSPQSKWEHRLVIVDRESREVVPVNEGVIY